MNINIDVDLDDIEHAIQTLNRLKEIAQTKNDEKWQPKSGNFYISSTGGVYFRNDSSSLETGFGNRFETEAEAKKASKVYRKFHRLYKLAEELNEGWEPNWNDLSQPKYRLVYDCRGENFFISVAHTGRQVCGIVFKSEEAAEKAIKILEQEE